MMIPKTGEEIQEMVDRVRQGERVACAGDGLALAVLQLIDIGRLDTRSWAGDALLRYAAARTGAVDDALNEFRRMMQPQQEQPAEQPVIEPEPILADWIGRYRVGPAAPDTWKDNHVVGVEPDGSTWAARDGEGRAGFWSWETVAAMARRGEYRRLDAPETVG